MCENGFAENGVTMVAERKDRADGMVEIINYATRTIIEGFDFSGRVRPHQVALHGNVLQVTGQQRLLTFIHPSYTYSSDAVELRGIWF
ncbi:hypothetical protein SCFA_2100008 [anaerobic digester metagenome]|uniref:Uncharacterized protein n=1 Tax=anaerobic digester metagenome TaxID=1263854 RepID=A0A485M2S8_9ZZZZ